MLIYAHFDFDCEICKPGGFWLFADSFKTVSKARLSNVLQSAFVVLRGDGEKEKKFGSSVKERLSH